MKIEAVNELIDKFSQLSQRNKKNNELQMKSKEIGKLAIHAFNSALVCEDPLQRFEMVNTVVSYMKKIAQYDESTARFLIAKKKMTRYALLEQLSDPNMVSFTLQDCEVLRRFAENNTQ